MLKKLCNLFSGVPATAVSGLFLSVSLILLIFGLHVPFDPAIVTVVLSGYPLLYLAVTRLFRQKRISSCLLISIAMIASLAIGELFAAGEVAFIMAIGAILEDKTVAKARQGLSNLISLTPAQGRRLKDGKEEMIAADEIQKGDMLRVKPGEHIPVDGIVTEGFCTADESIMTGESLPAEKAVGSQVFCGTVLSSGSVDMKATSVGEDSSLQKLIRLVEEADKKKAPMQRIADQWSVWLVPIALGIALCTVLFGWLFGLAPMDALHRGVTILVVFCPCALALATPTSIMAAIGQATKHGVIIKSGAALETMGKATVIAFDKTGTLTIGKPEVSDICPAEGISEKELLFAVACAEERSEHPLAKAVLEKAKAEGLSVSGAENFLMTAGRGVSVTLHGCTVLCGNEAFLEEHGISVSAHASLLDLLQEQGKALVLAAADDRYIGAVAFSDRLRPESRDVLDTLGKEGLRTVLLTGDNQRAANYHAAAAGLSDVKASLLPAGKASAVKALQQDGSIVCMVGDGVNDAPALKTAHVGVAMGSMGSDIAIESADIALMRDDLHGISYLARLARATRNTIRFNITVSMCINAVAVTLSILSLLNPVTGALVHNAGSCLVVLNAALLYDRHFD